MARSGGKNIVPEMNDRNKEKTVLHKEMTYDDLLRENIELRKILAETQIEMNRRMDTILSGISGGFKISRNDEKFSYIYVSEALANFLGYTVDEFISVSNGNVMDFVYPDDVEETYRKEQEDMSKGNTYSCKYRVRCRDGTIKWIIDSGKLIRNNDGEEYFYSLYLDVDELERSRLKQKEIRTLLEQIVGANPCGIAACSVSEKKVLQINREAIRLFCWEIKRSETGEMFIGNISPNIYDEDRDKVSDMALKLRQLGDSIDMVYRLKQGDSVCLWVQLRAKRLLGASGGEMLLITFLDITEKSQIEEALNESLQYFRIASQEAGNIIFTYDTAAMSVKFERSDVPLFTKGSPVFGVPYETVNNGTVAEESKAEYIRLHEAMINGETEAEGIVKRIAYAGNEMVMHLQFRALLDSRGNPTGKAVGVYVDITEEYLSKREHSMKVESLQQRIDTIEQDSRQSTQRFMEILSALSEEYYVIYLVDVRNDTFETVRSNAGLLPSIAELIATGNVFDKIFGQYTERYVHPEDKEHMRETIKLTNIRKRLSEERMYVTRFRRVIDGVTEYVEYKFVDVSETYEANRCVLAVRVVDQEVRRDIEQQELLRNALAEAQSANNAKSLFLSNMSHDIRTPMNAIVGFSNIAESHSDDHERVIDCVKKIKAASLHLQSLINDILDMSRIESGKMTLREDVCSLSYLTNNLVNLMTPLCEEKNLVFSADLDGIKGCCVYVDALKLRQILLNIIGNAIKFTGKGGKISFSVYKEDAPEEGFGRFIMTVSDTGIGMSEEFQKHLFEPFERETTSTISQTEGTGLGMTITKKLVDAMNGDIYVKSESGKGSTFTVVLDLRLCGENEFSYDEILHKKNLSDSADSSRFAGMRLLLVEDNPLNREIAMDILSDVGFKVDTAADGVDAIVMLDHSPVDYYKLVLMDIQMPVMNGYETTKAIRKKSRRDIADIPIMAMTANAFEEDKATAMQCGMNDHLAKPIDVNMLMEKLNRLL